MRKIFDEDPVLSAMAKAILSKEDWALHLALERSYPRAVELAAILLDRSGFGFDWMGAEDIAGKALYDYAKALQNDFSRFYAGYELKE